MNKRLLIGLVTGLFMAGMVGVTSITAFAGTIMVVADSNINNNYNFFSNVFGGSNVLTNSNHWSVTNFYSGVNNVATSYTTNTSITSSTLDGIDWFIATGYESFDASEINALSDFLDNNGSIWVVGEGAYYTSINYGSNTLLAALGSSMKIVPGNLSGTVSIAVDPFTTGVTTFNYAYASSVSGGTTLISIGNSVVAAYESTHASVPEPATMLLFGTGLIGLVGLRRRKNKK